MRSKAARFQAAFRGLLPASCLSAALITARVFGARVTRHRSADASRCVSAIAYLFAMGQKKKRHGAVIALQAARVRPQRKKKLDAKQSCGRRLVYVQGRPENCDGTTTSG